MRVKLYMKNHSCVLYYYIEADFFSAPRVGDYVTADWSGMRDAIIEDENEEDFLEYLSEDLREWYINPELQKTKEKPTKEQLREGLYFNELGIIDSVNWYIHDGVAFCEAWVAQV